MIQARRSDVRAILFGVALLVGLCSTARAIHIPPLSDEALAKAPLIVLARCTDKPAKDWPEEQLCTRTLVVDRAIRGELEPGKYTLVYSMYYFHPRLVEDLTRLHLWFLDRKDVVLAKTEREALAPLEGRGWRSVQPAGLEPYFLALLEGSLKERVSGFLRGPDPDLIIRALEKASGGFLPWPYEPDRFNRSGDRGQSRKDLADAVAPLLSHPSVRVRTRAVAAYAFLDEEKAPPAIRPLLGDKHPQVRTLASGILVRLRDEASLEKVAEAVADPKDPQLACRVVDAIAAWGRPELVPALAAFLENDGFAYYIGDDWGVPALRAQKALADITGHVFPFDATVSREAWSKAETLEDPGERLAVLVREAPFEAEPFEARVVNVGGGARVVLRNRTADPVTILRSPTSLFIKSESGRSGKGNECGGADDFIQIESGEEHTVPLDLPEGFFFADPASRKITLVYARLGLEFGVRAWMGWIRPVFGKDWQEPERRIETREERWPSGALKARGPVVNDVKHGVWTYWNEEGEKEREIEYVNGRVSKVSRFRTSRDR